MTEAATVLPMPIQGIKAYDPFRAQLAELKEENAKTVFDYASSKGNKEARSYVYKLRQTKTAVDAARKEEKAASLAYGKKVDDEAKEIIGVIQEMIDVHQSEIDRIEEAEKKRVALLTERFNQIQLLSETPVGDMNRLKAARDKLSGIVVDESFEEFREEAEIAHRIAVERVNERIAQQQKSDDDAAELEKLRLEKIERETRDKAEREAREAKEKAESEEKERAAREEKIRKEVEEKAREDAEAKAKADREAAEQRERDAIAAKEKAEREAEEAKKKAEADRIAAEQKAETDKQAAIEAERKRIEAEARAKADAEAKRKADEDHRDKIERQIHNAIYGAGSIAGSLSHEATDAIVSALVTGKIPNVTVNY